jgi:hypothetical protein
LFVPALEPKAKGTNRTSAAQLSTGGQSDIFDFRYSCDEFVFAASFDPGSHGHFRWRVLRQPLLEFIKLPTPVHRGDQFARLAGPALGREVIIFDPQVLTKGPKLFVVETSFQFLSQLLEFCRLCHRKLPLAVYWLESKLSTNRQRINEWAVAVAGGFVHSFDIR